MIPSASPSPSPDPSALPSLVPAYIYTLNPSVSPTTTLTLAPPVSSNSVTDTSSAIGTGGIIGIVVGGFVLLVLLGFAWFLGKRSSNMAKVAVNKDPEKNVNPVNLEGATGTTSKAIVAANLLGSGGIVTIGEVTKKFDVFLTHDWGMDEQDRSNHQRVVEVGKQLQELGVHAWLDEHELSQNILQEMTDGIDNSHFVVVFITDRYMKKVNGKDGRDNCKFEFQYAFKRLGPQSLIPVVMEARMRDQSKWGGVCGGALNSLLYVDMVSDDPKVFREKCRELKERIELLKIHEGEV